MTSSLEKLAPKNIASITLRSIVGLMLVAALAGPLEGGQEAGHYIPRVRISDDAKGIVLTGTGQAFVPWGFNYLGLFTKLAEDDWETPEGWQRIERDFREMRALGGNVVRWHLQYETFMEAPDRANPGQLARLKKLLGLARETGLYLDLTGLNCYRRDRIPDWYDALPEAQRWASQAKFWEAVAEICAGDPVVFCYDLMNEPVVGEPAAGQDRWVCGELGGFYFAQRICNKPDGRDATAIAEAWVERMVGAIRGQDRETLITVGVIPWALTWPGAKPVFYSPQVARHLDFSSVHFYPAPGRLEKELAALAVYDVGKPLVIEETFPLECSIADLDRFIDAAEGRVDGWMAHYFGYTPAQHRNGAKPAGAPTAEFLEYWKKRGETLATTPRPR